MQKGVFWSISSNFSMSETIFSEANAGNDSQPSFISGTTIHLAGYFQDSIQSIGGFLARLAGRSEREVMTMITIPSIISCGPSIFQVSLGSGEMQPRRCDRR